MKPNIKRTGDSAFPCTKEQHAWFPGMTLRDYFAAKALTDEVVVFHGGNKNAIANWCYGMADAMLKEREK